MDSQKKSVNPQEVGFDFHQHKRGGNSVYREVLDIHHEQLVDIMEPHGIALELLNEGVLGDFHYEELSRIFPQGIRAANRLLLAFITKQGSVGFHALLTALKHCGQHKVAAQLEQTSIEVNRARLRANNFSPPLDIRERKGSDTMTDIIPDFFQTDPLESYMLVEMNQRLCSLEVIVTSLEKLLREFLRLGNVQGWPEQSKSEKTPPYPPSRMQAIDTSGSGCFDVDNKQKTTNDPCFPFTPTNPRLLFSTCVVDRPRGLMSRCTLTSETFRTAASEKQVLENMNKRLGNLELTVAALEKLLSERLQMARSQDRAGSPNKVTVCYLSSPKSTDITRSINDPPVPITTPVRNRNRSVVSRNATKLDELKNGPQENLEFEETSRRLGILEVTFASLEKLMRQLLHLEKPLDLTDSSMLPSLTLASSKASKDSQAPLAGERYKKPSIVSRCTSTSEIFQDGQKDSQFAEMNNRLSNLKCTVDILEKHLREFLQKLPNQKNPLDSGKELPLPSLFLHV